jgi:hypothetical protein
LRTKRASADPSAWTDGAPGHGRGRNRASDDLSP